MRIRSSLIGYYAMSRAVGMGHLGRIRRFGIRGGLQMGTVFIRESFLCFLRSGLSCDELGRFPQVANPNPGSRDGHARSWGKDRLFDVFVESL